MKKQLPFFLLALSLILANCKKRDLNPGKEEHNDYATILKMGFDTTGIVTMENYYVVENDIVIEKSKLSTLPRQAYSSNSQLVDPSKQRNITIRIDQSVYNAAANFNWSAEVSQAIAEYNNLEASNIRFQLVTTSTANIVIKTGYNSNTNVIAEAPLPSSGNPGSFVQINTNFSGTNTSSDKKWSLIHELGHCIGFKHTNWYDATGTGPFPAIGNSPNDAGNRDWESFMHASRSGYNIFSDWDIYAISTLYPNTDGIPGPAEFCSSATYGYNNLPGGSSVNWTVPYGFTSSTSGNAITLTRMNGFYANTTLTGQVVLSNGATINVSRFIKSSCMVSVEFRNTSSSFIAGGIQFYDGASHIGSGGFGSGNSTSTTSIKGGYWTIKAVLAPGNDPYYVSVGGGSPTYVSSYGGITLGTYQVGDGFYITAWR